MAKKIKVTDRTITAIASRQTDFGKAKVQFECKGTVADSADMVTALTEMSEELETLADERISVYEEGGGVDREDDTPEPEEEPTPEEESEPEEEEIELTEELVNEMSKEDLVDLCKGTEGLDDIDTSKGVKVIRVMIIDALFEEEETEGTEEDATDDTTDDGEWQDDDWKD